LAFRVVQQLHGPDSVLRHDVSDGFSRHGGRCWLWYIVSVSALARGRARTLARSGQLGSLALCGLLQLAQRIGGGVGAGGTFLTGRQVAGVELGLVRTGADGAGGLVFAACCGMAVLLTVAAVGAWAVGDVIVDLHSRLQMIRL